jgi:hypothetical protein
MPKKENSISYLLALLGIVMVVAIPMLYEWFDTEFYEDHGDQWKEFWLPATTSVFATLITGVIMLTIFGSVQRAKTSDQTDETAKKLMQLMDERLVKLRSEAYQDALIEILTRIKLPLDAPRSNVLDNTESNKEIDAPMKRSTRKSGANK